jgi:alanyl-tRNA synthetase
MGLERTAAVVQGKRSFYDTDLFAPIIERVCKLAGVNYGENEEADRAIRIIAEHSRALAFLIAAGIMPSNEGRGYVLRRVLRRAARFGRILRLDKPFLAEVAKVVIDQMGDLYPELGQNRELILNVIGLEEEKFREALVIGTGVLDGTIIKLRNELEDYFPRFEKDFNGALSKGDIIDLSHGVEAAMEHFPRDCGAWEHILSIGGRDAVSESLEPIEAGLTELKNVISNPPDPFEVPFAFRVFKQQLQQRFKDIKANVESVAKNLTGFEAFILYDTYGFPVELTAEIAAENGLTVDLEGFEREMAKQRERARAAQKEGKATLRGEGRLSARAIVIPRSTDFVGYEATSCRAKVVGLLIDDKPVEEAKEGQQVQIALSKTPFYSEMGGQVGDTGEIRGPKGRLQVINTIRQTVRDSDLIVHQGKIEEGSLRVEDEVEAAVDVERRLDISRNHTATHLLHAALRKVLGSHVRQMGSLVAPERLRFDFSHYAPVADEELRRMQQLVNEKIRHNLMVESRVMPYEQAVAEGALALFGEKYGDMVRVVEIKAASEVFSAELCGGTHVARTGEIGFFYIVAESSIGAGLRRIEAVTGRGAEAFVESRSSVIEVVSRRLQTSPTEVESKVASLLTELDSERKRAAALQRKLSKAEVEQYAGKHRIVNGIPVNTAQVSASNMEGLREMAEWLREKQGGGVVVLGADFNNRANFVVMGMPDLVAKGFHAGKLVNQVAAVAGGKGGGSVVMGQGSGKDKNRIDEALKSVDELIKKAVKGEHEHLRA